MMRYKKVDNAFYIFADDIAPRYLSCILPLDYDTVAAGDKFGNVVVLRLPREASQQVGKSVELVYVVVAQKRDTR